MLTLANLRRVVVAKVGKEVGMEARRVKRWNYMGKCDCSARGFTPISRFRCSSSISRAPRQSELLKEEASTESPWTRQRHRQRRQRLSDTNYPRYIIFKDAEETANDPVPAGHRGSLTTGDEPCSCYGYFWCYRLVERENNFWSFLFIGLFLFPPLSRPHTPLGLLYPSTLCITRR